MKSLLFTPLDIGPIRVKNRIVMAPMCQYSAVDGTVQDWHMVHYPARAYGGAGLVILEATAVEARGRISPEDLGIWSDDHIPGLTSLVSSISDAGALPGIQLAHAGRKASTSRPFDGFGPLMPDNGGWQVIGPSAVKYAENYPMPRAMSIDDIQEVQEAFILAARRAIAAGFKVIEIHAAHGYLIHSFLSPVSNHREDIYGGDFAGRSRFILEIAREIRSVCGDDAALFVRISADDWMENGWKIEDSVKIAELLKSVPVNMLHVSSGGISPHGKPSQSGRGFQVSLSETIRREAGIPTTAVGLITEAEYAESLLQAGRADLVALGRELLRDPYWPQRAALALNAEAPVPLQYARAWRNT
jgi:2,4-dienoyl-CoA reductase-like NADH-dependent reductase (Old Yellow Enzyme family)